MRSACNRNAEPLDRCSSANLSFEAKLRLKEVAEYKHVVLGLF